MFSPFAFSLPGGPEWILIFLVVLLLFGAKRLPDLARGMARSLTEFRKAKEEFDQELHSAKSDVSLDKNKSKQPASEQAAPQSIEDESVEHGPEDDPHHTDTADETHSSKA